MTSGRQYNHDLRIETLAELGASKPHPFGIRAFVDEDGSVYINVGRTTDEIARLLGWEDSDVWMPDHALANIRKRHTIFIDPFAAASLLLRHPESVYADLRHRSFRVFFARAALLRESGLLASNSTRYVDAIIERRLVEGGYVLRLFHLSPRSHHPQGARLWP